MEKKKRKKKMMMMMNFRWWSRFMNSPIIISKMIFSKMPKRKKFTHTKFAISNEDVAALSLNFDAPTYVTVIVCS